MGDLNFISDVIYHLKMDMGMLMTFGRRTVTRSLVTGVRTTTQDRFSIELGIYLPVNLRAQFLRSVGIHREGYIESGNREILIDKADIPTGKVIQKEDMYVEINGKQGEVVAVDDYKNALIVTVKHVTGMPT